MQNNSDLVERDRVCALEIWCEALGGQIRDFKRTDAQEINDILRTLPDWEKMQGSIRFGYCGKQRGFQRRHCSTQRKDVMSEKEIEQYLVEGVRGVGGLCLKFVSPGRAGVPDRLIITPNGRVIFVELKTEAGRLSKIQEYVISELKKRNADVRVLYGLRDVKEFLQEMIPDEV